MQNFDSYIHFIRYSIGSQSTIPDNSRDIDWDSFYSFCIRQSIAGLVFDGFERSGLEIPQEILFEWIGSVETIKSTNMIVDKRCQQISRFWDRLGYHTCILKGQANAMMYPRPELRSPGDIDIWVDGHSDVKESTDDTAKIIRIALREAPGGHYSLHHVTMPVFNDTSVEVHYRPVFLDNWWLDKKLRRYTEQVKGVQFKNKIVLSDGKTEICGLTDEFNAVFLMLHMWHHLLSTRNNLKQLIDYYYLLKKDIPSEKREGIGWLFYELGVYKYACGVMWIMNSVLGLPTQYLIVDPDEEIGRLLWSETLHYGENRKKRNKLGKLVNRVTRNLHLFWHFPKPVLIAPIYLVWHQWWKMRMRIKLKNA